ncbi:hypothetical protein ASG11_02160 [Sphingomonas sp. Leaf357]|nr:hypothetical protein ASG11_02160 [Sphingomonas sp. Leaf357]
MSRDVRPAAKRTGCHLLIVMRQDIASRRDGFRPSDRYAKWRDMPHEFHDPMPTVTYFAESIL